MKYKPAEIRSIKTRVIIAISSHALSLHSSASHTMLSRTATSSSRRRPTSSWADSQPWFWIPWRPSQRLAGTDVSLHSLGQQSESPAWAKLKVQRASIHTASITFQNPKTLQLTTRTSSTRNWCCWRPEIRAEYASNGLPYHRHDGRWISPHMHPAFREF